MSRVENVIQASCRDLLLSHQLQYMPCGRCHAVIEYDQGEEWCVVSELVNEHWKACPGKPYGKLAHMARAANSSLDLEVALPPQAAPEQRSSSNPNVGSTGSPNTPWVSVGCERRRRTLEQRKLELEQDEYAKNVTTKSVVCKGCHKEISLDKRSKYYPGLWVKHKSKCPNIEKLERAKTKTLLASNSTRQVSGDIINSAEDDSNNADVQNGDSTERYRSSAAAHLTLVRHYDSEDSPSGDDNEDEDSPPHEPFPVLNCAFYRTQRYNNRSNDWTYRYATRDEITANRFRGQNEQYARLSIRPFTNPTPQTGQCETMHCIIGDRA